jgi:RNA polymerase sigma factor for flagellar operon FliA
MVKEFMPAIRMIAKKFIRKLPRNYEVDDLISCGVVGLLEALEKYDPDHGVLFKTFAEHRIRGSMLDELRSQDWASRNLRDKIKGMERARREVAADLGREASDAEMRVALSMDADEFYALARKVAPVRVVSLSDASSNEDSYSETSSSGHNPADLVAGRLDRVLLEREIEKLSSKEAEVMRLYYFEEKSMREISLYLGVSESRVSQIHNHGLTVLKMSAESRWNDRLAA